MSTGAVLVVEDNADMRDFLISGMTRRGLTARAAPGAAAALELLEADEPDVVLTDLNMPGMSGLELCQRIVAMRPGVPVVVVTAFGSLDTAVGAIRAGAYDFVQKPVELDALMLVLERAIAHRRLHAELKRLRESAASAVATGAVVGRSPPVLKVFDLIERICDSDATVLVTGESGTGKELVVRTLHERSKRREGPFVAVNCAAMPEALLESELFGHVKGAFTDAKTAKVGLFAQANGGTLFLDEVGELPLGLQPKLLRALQERKVRPVGGTSELDFDTRIVAATNRDLERWVEEGRFREDLFYRLNVINLELPPLRARGNDVLLLAQHFVETLAAKAHKAVKGLSPGVAERLVAYTWPGNVRELQNCIERAVALARFELLSMEDLPPKVQDFRPTQLVPEGVDSSALVSLAEMERRYILRVLEAVGGSRQLAAKTLDVDRKTLYRRLEQYGVAED